MSKTSTSDQGAGFIIIASLITLSISFYQTAIGYESLFGSVMAWVISGIVTLFMLRTNLQIRSYLKESRNVIGLVLFFLILAAVSFVGNFNAFYSRDMRSALYDRELKEYQADIPGLVNKATLSLGKTNNYQDIEAEVKQLNKSLKAQITNPGDPGIGQKAQAIIKKIDDLLGSNLTILNGTDSVVADEMYKQVEDILEAKKITMNQNVIPLIEQIEKEKIEIMSIIELAIDPSVIEQEGRTALEKSVRAYNSICSSTKSIIPNFDCEKRFERNLNVGSINHTLRSAFVEKQNSTATILSVLASLFIDFLVPAYIFLTVRPESTNPSSAPVINKGRIIPTKRSWWERITGNGDDKIGPEQL